MRPLALGCGLLLLLAAGLLGLVWLLGLATVAAGGAAGAVLAGAAGLLAALFGGALAYAGASGGLGAARRRFGPALVPLSVAGFLIVLGLGCLVILAGALATAFALPPLQLLAALLPALALIGLAAWRRGGGAWRKALVGLAYGGCGATSLALVAEMTLGLVLIALLLSGPGGEALSKAVEELVAELQRAGPDGVAEMEGLLRPLLSPAVIATAFVLVGLLGPLAEELAKALGVALVGPATADRAWWWGVAIGAGFGVAEALTYGAMTTTLPDWPVNMTVRALTTLMHATVGGLGGLAVYQLLAGRRRAGLGLFGLAWLTHAAWNCAVLLFTVSSLMGPAKAGDGPLAGLQGGTALIGLLGVASLVALFGLVVVTFRVLSASGFGAGPATASAPAAGAPPEAPGPAATGELPDPAATPPDPPPAASPPGDGDPGAPAAPGPAAAEPDPEPDADIPGLGRDLTWRPPPAPE